MTVLVIAAHPDDEALGCGGAIARHAGQGEDVHVLFLADGVTSRDETGEADVEKRRAAALAAAKALGAKPPRFAGMPDNKLDTVPLLDVVKAVEEALTETVPDVVYTHHGGDLNVDHGIVHRAALTACRPQPGCPVRAIYAFEVPSSTEWNDSVFIPNRFVDIGATLDAKMKALACYAGEMRPFPHPRSLEAIEALARWRGASAGLEAAEAFHIIRQVVP